MSRWGEREYYGRIHGVLPEDGVLRTRFEDGDIAYWPRGNALAVFFAQTGRPELASPVIIIGRVL